MSLPHPTTKLAPFPSFTKAEQDQMEPALLALASKSGGDLRKLLYAFFSFLNRRTDFYLIPNEKDVEDGAPLRMGFKEGDAEKLLLAAFRQFPLRRMPVQTVSSPSTAKSTIQETKLKKESNSKIDKEAKVKNSDAKPVTKPINSQKDPPKTATDNEIRRTDEGKQIPVGNGGITEKYHWTQTIEETSVIVAVPPGTRGKELDVSIKASSISVRFKKDKNAPPLVEGKLVEKIRTEESTWSLEGSAVLLTLEKIKRTWWETVIEGDDAIDTSLVDSTRKIGTYDGATQAHIRKILFDQKQERLGKPTSDEIIMEGKRQKSLPEGVEYIDKEKMNEIKKT